MALLLPNKLFSIANEAILNGRYLSPVNFPDCLPRYPLKLSYLKMSPIPFTPCCVNLFSVITIVSSRAYSKFIVCIYNEIEKQQNNINGRTCSFKRKGA